MKNVTESQICEISGFEIKLVHGGTTTSSNTFKSIGDGCEFVGYVGVGIFTLIGGIVGCCYAKTDYRDARVAMWASFGAACGVFGVALKKVFSIVETWTE